jgi:uncharacterized membrane protein
MLENIPEWLWIFFTSMVPWWEGRYAVFFAIKSFGWTWWHAYPIAVLGNIIPVPFILLFFKHIEKWLKRYKFWTSIMDWLFTRTRDRADETIRKYEHIGLLIFVALPIIFTGAWTGSLISYLFDLKFTKSLITIFIGILIATGIMAFVAITEINTLFIIAGLITVGFIMGLIVFLGSSKKKN